MDAFYLEKSKSPCRKKSEMKQWTQDISSELYAEKILSNCIQN